MIPTETIAQVRAQHELIAFIQAAGIKLRRHGRDYLGLCPFHADRSPSLSVSPSKQYWCCHGGCSANGKKAGGDVIEFARRLWGVELREAVERLGGRTIDALPPRRPKTPARKRAVPPRIDLEQVMAFYHQSFLSSVQAKEYLRSRGITSPDLVTALPIGYADGSLLDRAPEGSETCEALLGLGVLTANGRTRELMYGCLVVPLRDLHGRIVNLYGRVIDRDAHVYLPGPRRGLVNAACAASSSEIILTESVIDALSFLEAGMANAIPVYGVNGWTSDHDALIEQHRIRSIILALDADEAGQKAADALAHKLAAQGINVRNLVLPAKDPNELLVREGGERFAATWRGLMAENVATDMADSVATNMAEIVASNMAEIVATGPATEPPAAKGKPIEPASVLDPGSGSYTFSFGSRAYRVTGLTLFGLDRMRVTVRVEQQGRVHIDTFDLYSARGRRNFIDSAIEALMLGESEQGALSREMNDLIASLERERLALRGKAGGQAAEPLMTPGEREEALRMLRSPDLLEILQADFALAGCVGEETSMLVAYLVALSRKLAEPLSAIFCARSGAGKSNLQNTVLDLTPPEDVERFTRITGNALFYEDENRLVHKVLAIDEEDGATEAAYSLRSLQSAGYLAVSSTRTDPHTGKQKAEHYRVNGPVVIFFTTAHPEVLDYETRNRFVMLTPDESREQTRRILERQRWGRTLDGLVANEDKAAVLRRHHNAQRLLEPLRVVIPDALSLTFPSDRLIVRREQTKYLALIEVIALFHQHQRSRKTRLLASGEKIDYIEAATDDIELARSLARTMLRRNLDDLAPPTRALLVETDRLVRDKCEAGEIPRAQALITRQEIQKATGLSYWHLRVYLQQLVECEYLCVARGAQGKRIAYELLWDGDEDDPAAEL